MQKIPTLLLFVLGPRQKLRPLSTFNEVTQTGLQEILNGRVPDATARTSPEIPAGAWADEHHGDIGGGQIFAFGLPLSSVYAILHGSPRP